MHERCLSFGMETQSNISGMSKQKRTFWEQTGLPCVEVVVLVSVSVLKIWAQIFPLYREYYYYIHTVPSSEVSVLL